MRLLVTLAQVAKVAPNARSSYRTAFERGQAILDHCGISKNALRVAHFMAQVLHESGGLTIQIENMNYSSQRLPVVWPKRFKPRGALDPVAFAHNPAVEWLKKGCNEKADADSIEAVTLAINGGQIGLPSRQEWLRKTKNIWNG